MMNIMPWNARNMKQCFKAMVHVSDEAWKYFQLVEMKREAATRNPVWDALTAEDPFFVSGVGHGNEDTFTGDIAEIAEWIFRTTDCDILAGRITHLLSCSTAVNLGPAIIAAGGIAYAGYNRTWWWITEDVNVEIDPYTGYIAESYFRSANEFPVALIQGETALRAKERCWNEYTKFIELWETDPERQAHPWAADVIKYLIHDRNSLTVLGDMSATIIPPPPRSTMAVEVEPPPTSGVGKTISFTGYLREIETGRVIPGKTINLWDSGTPIASTTTGGDGGWAFAVSFEIADHVLHAEFPGDAEYPLSRTSRYLVRIAPVDFGNQEVGTRDVAADYDRIVGGIYTCPVLVRAYSMTIHLLGGHPRTKCAIYDSLGNFVAATEERTDITSEGLHTFVFPEPVKLDAGDYYLVFMVEGRPPGGWLLVKSAPGIVQQVIYGPWPSTLAPSTTNREYTIWCSATAGVPFEHTVTINSSPVAGVPVAVDGRPIGTTPTTIRLIEGSHTVETAEEIET